MPLRSYPTPPSTFEQLHQLLMEGPGEFPVLYWRRVEELEEELKKSGWDGDLLDEMKMNEWGNLKESGEEDSSDESSSEEGDSDKKGSEEEDSEEEDSEEEDSEEEDSEKGENIEDDVSDDDWQEVDEKYPCIVQRWLKE
jgi:hypothetical protein